MDKHLLAQQLRQRQYTQGHLPRHLIDAVSGQAPRHRMPGLVRQSTWPVETPRGQLRD
jgi:hypothetical protein